MDPIILEVGIAAVTVLGSINAYFIKGLINKLDKVDKATTKYEEQITQLKEKVDQFAIFIKDVSDLKSEVAVIKFAIGYGKQGGTNG